MNKEGWEEVIKQHTTTGLRGIALGGGWAGSGGPLGPPDEVRTVDPLTGGEKGSKLQRFSLIPREFLWELASHYGRGAKKYTRYGECSCAKIAESLERLILDNGAVPVMKSGFGKTILNLPSDSYKIAEVGVNEIPSKLKSWTEVMEAVQHPSEKGLPPLTALAWKNTIASFPALVVFAENPTNLDILITTILRVSLGDLSATDAISQLDSLKNLHPTGLTKHWLGCSAFKIEKSGDRNWEKGYKWSLSQDAFERHYSQWLMGENTDAETGTHHLICAIWHLIALWWFQTKGRGTNDILSPPKGGEK